MDWEINYLQQEGVVTIKTSGTLVDADENQKMVTEALVVAEKYDATKCLIDDQDLTLEMKTIDIYGLPEILDDLGVPRKYRVAIVVAESARDVEGFKFYETRAFNVGFNHRLFTDTQTALDWLHQSRG